MLHNSHQMRHQPTIRTVDPETGLLTLLGLCATLHTLYTTYTPFSVITMRLQPTSTVATIQAAWESVQHTVAPCNDALGYRIDEHTYALSLPYTSRAAALQLAEVMRRRIETHGYQAIIAVASAPHDAGDVGGMLAVCQGALFGRDEPNRVYAATPVESLPPATAALMNTMAGQWLALVDADQHAVEAIPMRRAS